MPSPPQSSDLANLAPAPTQQLNDPFLAQIHSRNIPITDRDRQEGYDVDLVNAQPRGPTHSAALERIPTRDRHSLGQQPAGPSVAAAAAAAGPSGTGAAYGDYSDDEGKRESTAAGASYGGITSTDPFLLEGADRTGAGLNKKQRTKRWILRPLPLAVIIAFLCALALALGLGIGLTKKSSNRAAVAAQTSGRHTTAAPAVSGTVIPSSAFTTTTKAKATVTATTVVANGPIATALTSSATSATTDVSAAAVAAATVTASATTTTKTLASPITSTVYASTGDLPVPADSETTRDGTVYSSATVVHKRGFIATAQPPTPTAFLKARKG